MDGRGVEEVLVSESVCVIFADNLRQHWMNINDYDYFLVLDVKYCEFKTKNSNDNENVTS